MMKLAVLAALAGSASAFAPSTSGGVLVLSSVVSSLMRDKLIVIWA